MFPSPSHSNFLCKSMEIQSWSTSNSFWTCWFLNMHLWWLSLKHVIRDKGSVKSSRTQWKLFALLCLWHRRWSVQMFTFRSHHHETQTSTTQWRECLDPGGANRIRKALHSKLGLFKLNQSPNLKILDYIILPLFENRHTAKHWNWLLKLSTFAHPNQHWLVHEVGRCRNKTVWLGKHVYVLSNLIFFLIMFNAQFLESGSKIFGICLAI